MDCVASLQQPTSTDKISSMGLVFTAQRGLVANLVTNK